VTTQLSLYNDALLNCGERFLSALTDQSEPRRLLDQVWASNGVRTCLEQGQWFFAMRTVEIDYDAGIEPDYGYNRAFVKPIDWVLTSAVATDAYFRSPQTRYVDEAGYWYSDVDTLYVRYVSDDAGYGLNFGLWPDTFREFVAAHFASKIILKITNNVEDVERMLKLRRRLLVEAKDKSLMAGPTQWPAQGAWTRARNRFPNRRDGGGPYGNLIG